MHHLAGDSADSQRGHWGLGKECPLVFSVIPTLSCSLLGERLGHHLCRGASGYYGQGAESQSGMRFLQRTPWWVPALESQPHVT